MIQRIDTFINEEYQNECENGGKIDLFYSEEGDQLDAHWTELTCL